ncbi:MAG: cell division protein ZapA [Novosphingobium sp.]
MSNVDLNIGGRVFKVACAAGEEDHVSGLGRMINEKVAAVPGASGQSEGKMLLFASLMLADEVHEARRSGPSAEASAVATPDPAVATRLEQIATALEKCASALEG